MGETAVGSGTGGTGGTGGKRLLLYGNVVGTDGFGRIGNELLRRLQLRGWQVGAAGIFTPHVPFGWPYQVWALAGHDIWSELQNVYAGMQPDVLLVCQDFPYLDTASKLTRLDYSQTALVGITPVDGVPINSGWIGTAKRYDSLLTISKFGATAFREQGAVDRWGGLVRHLQMGVNVDEFGYADADERAVLRKAAGIADGVTVFGGFMANQGRKCWPEVLELFGRYRAYEPGALLLCDCDSAVGAGGWNLAELAEQIAATRGLPPFKDGLRFRSQYQQIVNPLTGGGFGLRERMALCDVALQLAYREGYGLPIAECQSVGTLALAQDYCSGTELCANGRGLLVQKSKSSRFGGWGNALDVDPDLEDALAQLLWRRENPSGAAALVETARKAVAAETWDASAQQLIDAITAAQRNRATARRAYAIQEAQRAGLMPPAGAAPTPASAPLGPPPGADSAVPPVPVRLIEGADGQPQPIMTALDGATLQQYMDAGAGSIHEAMALAQSGIRPTDLMLAPRPVASSMGVGMFDAPIDSDTGSASTPRKRTLSRRRSVHLTGAPSAQTV